MKAPVKVKKMILVDYQKYMNLLNHAPDQKSTAGAKPIDPLSSDSALELNSHFLRTENRIKHESMQKINQENEIANLIEQLKKLKTQTGSDTKKVDMSTGTDDEFKTYADKGTSANPTTSDASTQILYKYGEYPGYHEFLNKSPKKEEERETRNRGNPYDRRSASASKLHTRKPRMKSAQTGAGWYRMPFD